MRSPIIKVLPIAILAFIVLLLEANGAPALRLESNPTIISHSVVERAPPPIGKGSGSGSKGGSSSKPSKPGVGSSTGGKGSVGPGQRTFVIDPEIKGYTIINSRIGTTGDGWNLVDVFNKDGKLDTLGTRLEDNGATVFSAWNNFDVGPNKISLRGLILGVWKKESGRNVEDLRKIHYNSIIEKDVQSAMDDAYSLMQKDFKQNRIMSVSARGTAPGEQEAFQRLLTGNPFGVGVQKMIDEYMELSYHRIANFVIDRKTGAYNLDVEFEVIL